MPSLPNYPQPTAALQTLYDRISEAVSRSYPVRDLPLNIRPLVVFATAAWLIVLGVLGMAPLPELSINDKALHFFGLGFATFLIYFVIDVPESPQRRIWYIRRAPLLLTLFCAFFVGGIISEFVQGTLPWKTFQWGDIVANLLGSSLFLYLAHTLYQRTRRRNEISSLYQPLSGATYRDSQGREHAFDGSNPSNESPVRFGRPSPYRGGRSNSNVWDDTESDAGRPSGEDTYIGRGGGGNTVFGIGGDDEESQVGGPMNGNVRL